MLGGLLIGAPSTDGLAGDGERVGEAEGNAWGLVGIEVNRRVVEQLGDELQRQAVPRVFDVAGRDDADELGMGFFGGGEQEDELLDAVGLFRAEAFGELTQVLSKQCGTAGQGLDLLGFGDEAFRDDAGQVGGVQKDPVGFVGDDREKRVALFVAEAESAIAGDLFEVAVDEGPVGGVLGAGMGAVCLGNVVGTQLLNASVNLLVCVGFRARGEDEVDVFGQLVRGGQKIEDRSIAGMGDRQFVQSVEAEDQAGVPLGRHPVFGDFL